MECLKIRKIWGISQLVDFLTTYFKISIFLTLTCEVSVRVSGAVVAIEHFWLNFMVWVCRC